MESASLAVRCTEEKGAIGSCAMSAAISFRAGARPASSLVEGNPCDYNQPCAAGSACDVTLVPCPGGGTSNVSRGGVCDLLPACATSPLGCQGMPCSADRDCDVDESCMFGTCQTYDCTGLGFPCVTGCTSYMPPHSCNGECVCPSWGG
jgi:hypothetical protein